MMSDIIETSDFEYAARRIASLLERLNSKRICGCCTARALLYHGAHLAEETVWQH